MGGTVENQAEQARILSIQSEECAKRLQTLENDVAIPTSTDANPVIHRTSIDTTASARSIVDSILSLYGHESLYERLSESQGEALETGVDQARVLRITEDHRRKSAVVDLDGLDSPLILPCTSEYSLDSSTASNDEAIGDLQVEYFDHLGATELGTSTESYEFDSDQLQYDGERIVSGLLLSDTLGSFGDVLSVLVNAKYCHYTLCMILFAMEFWPQCSRRSKKAMWRVRMKFASTVRSKI